MVNNLDEGRGISGCEVLKETHELEGLRDAWRSLLARSDADGVFMTWEYAMEWWATFGESYELRVVIARDGRGRISGIAPLMVGPGNTMARRYIPHLAFVGQLNESLTEYQEFIARPGHEEAVGQAVASVVTGVLRGEWDVLFFPVIRKGSVAMEAFERALGDGGFSPRRMFPQESPRVALPETWEAFLAAKSKNSRKKVKRSEKLFLEKFETELHVAGEDVPLEVGMAELERLNGARWGRAARSFSSDGFGALHQRLAKCFLDRGWLSLLLLKADGRYVAAQYDFVYGGKVWGFQGGWEPAFGEHAVGKVLMSMALRRYIAMGLSEYDFLAGEAEYKTSWADGRRMVYDLEMVDRSSLRGLAFGVMRGLREAVTGERERVRSTEPTAA